MHLYTNYNNEYKLNKFIKIGHNLSLINTKSNYEEWHAIQEKILFHQNTINDLTKQIDDDCSEMISPGWTNRVTVFPAPEKVTVNGVSIHIGLWAK